MPVQNIISNYFLGALLLVLSIRTSKSVFFYFNDDLAGLYIHIGLIACFFIGPALYFYLKENFDLKPFAHGLGNFCR